jgi:hypothetical protein
LWEMHEKFDVAPRLLFAFWVSKRFLEYIPMVRGRVRFKETEVARAARGAVRAGLRVERIEVAPDGKLSLVTSRGNQEAAPDTNPADTPGLRSWD